SRRLPDRALGFGRMVEHVELLDSCRVPPPPEPPPLVPVAEGSGGTSEFQTFDQPEDPNGPTIVLSPETDHSAPGVSSQKKAQGRSEEHTSELQSRENLVCRLLLEKKKKQ